MSDGLAFLFVCAFVGLASFTVGAVKGGDAEHEKVLAQACGECPSADNPRSDTCGAFTCTEKGWK